MEMIGIQGPSARREASSRRTTPTTETTIKIDEIDDAQHCRRRECPVERRDAVAWRRFESWISHEAEQQRERKMDDAGLSVVEDTDTDHVGDRRGIPELEQRPCDGNHAERHADRAGRAAPAKIGLRDQFFEIDVARRRRIVLYLRCDPFHMPPSTQPRCRGRTALSPRPFVTSSLFPCRISPQPDAAAP